MIEQLPPWIDPPSWPTRQTEVFRLWGTLIHKRIIQNPPHFLCHLSPSELQAILAVSEKTATAPNTKLTPLLGQILAYKRQVELIAWSPFVAMGQKMIDLRKILTQHEFEKMLEQIGLSLEEAEISMAAARLETA
jgi:hypothetical protein